MAMFKSLDPLREKTGEVSAMLREKASAARVIGQDIGIAPRTAVSCADLLDGLIKVIDETEAQRDAALARAGIIGRFRMLLWIGKRYPK